MEYDDRERSRQRKSRSRQPVKRPGGREPDYRRDREPSYQRRGRQEPELTLITDTFRDNRHRQSQGKSRAQRQIAATRTDSSPYHNHAKKKARRKRNKILIILAELLILVGVLTFTAFHYVSSSMGLIQRLPWNPEEIKNLDISEEKQEQMKGYWTIAIFGVDSRNSSVGKGNNSDVNIICNINMDTGEIKLVSVYRDTYVNINDKNSYNKINAAYLQGGPELAVKALNKNLDLDIDDYATFNWKTVADVINILGGVDVEISKKEFFYINAFITETVKVTGVPSEQLTHAGLNHLDGVQAVAYGRLRLMDTDYTRTERQRKIIALAFEKLKTADWKTLSYIMQTVFPQVATSIELDDILGEIGNLPKFHLGETLGFPMEKKEADLGNKGDCVLPDTLESNVVVLHQFLFGDEAYTPTETVKTISNKIASDFVNKRAVKSTEPARTSDGSASKSTEEITEDTEKEYDSKKESSDSDNLNRESGDRETREWETGYSDEYGVYWESGAYPGSAGRETQTSRPNGGSGTSESTGIARPGSQTEESTEGGIPRPGTGGTSGTTSGYDTGTGVIIGPVNNGNGNNGSGNSSLGNGNSPGQNMPGGGVNSGNEPGINQNAPGSGQSSNGGESRYPGASGTTAAYQQPGSGNVEFSGPNGQ